MTRAGVGFPFLGAAADINGQHMDFDLWTTAVQEFWLQPLTLPLEPQCIPPRWHSRTVWAYVTANEHDPQQQGRVQVEFDWEHLDPPASHERAWLHTLTPYGGGSKPDAHGKAQEYNGFYSLPDIFFDSGARSLPAAAFAPFAEELLPVVKPKPKTWISIALKDGKGKPAAGERYLIHLPDGTTEHGLLDKHGKARVGGIDPGTAQVSFPDSDADDWHPG